jgi:hypothetical protein
VETIVAARIEVPLGSPALMGLARFTFPPGTSTAGGSFAGPRLILVETGVLMVVLTDPATIIRNRQAVSPVAEPARGTIIMRPGDRLITLETPPVELRNDGAGPAIFVDAAVWPGAPSDIAPFTNEDGIVFEPLAIGTVDTLPPAPVEMRLSWVRVPSRGMVPLEALAGPRLVYVDSGTLVLGAMSGQVTYSPAAVNSPGSVPGRARRVFPGDRALLTAGGTALIDVGAAGTAENLGRREMRLLFFSLMPAGEGDLGAAATPFP